MKSMVSISWLARHRDDAVLPTPCHAIRSGTQAGVQAAGRHEFTVLNSKINQITPSLPFSFSFNLHSTFVNISVWVNYTSFLSRSMQLLYF